MIRFIFGKKETLETRIEGQQFHATCSSRYNFDRFNQNFFKNVLCVSPLALRITGLFPPMKKAPFLFVFFFSSLTLVMNFIPSHRQLISAVNKKGGKRKGRQTLLNFHVLIFIVYGTRVCISKCRFDVGFSSSGSNVTGWIKSNSKGWCSR